MGMASKRSSDQLLMVGAATMSIVVFYFVWKDFISVVAPDDMNEDGEKELRDLDKLM
jgi:hypothetical protein